MSRRGEVLFEACYSVWPDEELIVEADGKGGATLLIVEGNYPIDYLIKQYECFSSEDAACDAADAMVDATYR
jgi:hypothetical protein